MSNISNFEKMWDLMKKYLFQANLEIHSHVTCVICNQLLINAYEGLCGCNFCKKCIDSRLESGTTYCPGPNDECRLVDICSKDSIVKSNSANRNVSKLIVSCPFELCDAKLNLLEMCDHVRICNNKELLCPFVEIGCTIMSMSSEKLDDHLTKEIHYHNNLLMEWLMNMRNEIFSRMINPETDEHSEKSSNIDQLIDDRISAAIDKNIEEDERKQNLIEKLLGELKVEKYRNYELENQLEKTKEAIAKETVYLKNYIVTKVEKIRTEWVSKERKTSASKLFRSSSKQEIDFSNSLKSIDGELNDLEAELMNQIDKLRQQVGITNETKTDTESSKIIDPINDDATPNTNEQLSQVEEERVKNIASFLWTISDIARVKKKGVVWGSEKFYSVNREYELWMDLYISGRSGVGESFLRIRTYLGIGSIVKESSWPFRGFISITIKDKMDHNCSQVISKQCFFDRPKICSTFESFVFPISSLNQSSVLQHNAVIVECYVDVYE